MRVIVVGAGVVGLTCAVSLAEAGIETHVLARDLPPETTSAVAAALWYPYRAAPRDAVTRWAARTYTELARLARDEPDSGVRMTAGVELLAGVGAGGSPGPGADSAMPDDPWWRSAVPALDSVRDPAPGRPWGWRLELPVADMTVYLTWLASRLEAAGGTITRSWLAELPASGVVVDATGLAARSLAADRSVHPVRGQVVRLAQTGVTEWLLDQTDPTRPLYVVPRTDDVVVGGTAEEDDWSTTPDPETARRLVDAAATLVPSLARARVLSHRVGLRPARPAVRLEAVPHADGGPGGVVHCYGHGGAGVTLSWGCAEDVRDAVAAILP